jgi:tRNA-dihydrouridine synthase A
MLGLFHGVKGAKLWRSHLSENAPKRKNDINVLKEALIKIEEIQKEVA